MRKLIEAFVKYVLQLFFLGGIVLVGATGCGTQKPTIITKHVLVAPDDNLLVDCEVAEPPNKQNYLRRYDSVMEAPDLSIGQEAYPYTTRYIEKLMKTAKERERQQTELNLKHYKNLGACNLRLAQLREWKAKAKRDIAPINKKE